MHDKKKTKDQLLHELKEARHRLAQLEKLEIESKEEERTYGNLSQEFQALLDAIPDNVTLQSPDLKILWANRGAAAGLGKKVSDLVGKKCYELWHRSPTPCELCPVQRSLLTGKEEIEQVSTYDGRLWELRTVPIKDEKGKVTRVVEVGRDITEHRKLEEQLRYVQKMEAIGQLTGGIAHDFNNILTAIIGYGTMLKMKMREDHHLSPAVEQILNSANKAAQLTQSLLTFSRKQILRPRPVKLNEIIQSVENLLSRIMGEDVELETSLTDGDLTILADVAQIEQVLMNLAANARDAMPYGGRLSIQTELVVLDEAPEKTEEFGKHAKYALITITDTGTGIDGGTRGKIFEPFFTTKEVGNGTGLGLSIVYGIIKQNNGFITVESKAGEGTSFRIYLPSIGSEGEVTAAQESLLTGGNETVLLAEDETEVRKLIKELLEEFGYTVVEAIDGEDAVKKFKEYKDAIQLLIFDVIMPKRNGKEAYEEIAKLRPDVKVLFTSGYTADILHDKVAFQDSPDFILKPVSPYEILRKVRDALRDEHKFR